MCHRVAQKARGKAKIVHRPLNTAEKAPVGPPKPAVMAAKRSGGATAQEQNAGRLPKPKSPYRRSSRTRAEGIGMTAVDFGAFIDELATVSGDAIRPFFRTSLGVEDKSRGGAFDPVTAADRAAELAMRTLIRQKFPAHGIIGEEFGPERSD